MLKWYDKESSKIENHSPLLFIPVEIIKERSKTNFKIKLLDDEVQTNISLMEKFRNDFGVEFPEYPSDYELGSLIQYIEKIEEKISSIPDSKRWSIDQVVYIDTFSFSKISLYSDMSKHLQELYGHKIIRIIGEETKYRDPGNNVREEAIISKYPRGYHTVLNADSTQMIAIEKALRGESLVIRGPPGTGKSQTIANLIAEFIANGKKILFVSQKIAALEVVKKRLDEVSLGQFCLEVHSHKSNKKEVLNRIESVMGLQLEGSNKTEREYKLLKTKTQSLDNYIEVVSRNEYFGDYTLYELIGQYSKLSDFPPLSTKLIEIPKTPSELDDIVSNVRRWFDASDQVKDLDTDPFREFGVKYSKNMDATAILQKIHDLHKGLIHLNREIGEFEEEIGFKDSYEISEEYILPLQNLVSRTSSTMNKVLLERDKINSRFDGSDLVYLTSTNVSTFSDSVAIVKAYTGEFNILKKFIEDFSIEKLEDVESSLDLLNGLISRFSTEQLSYDIFDLVAQREEYSSSLSRYFKRRYYTYRSIINTHFKDKSSLDEIHAIMVKLKVNKLNHSWIDKQYLERLQHNLAKIKSGLDLSPIGVNIILNFEEPIVDIFKHVSLLSDLLNAYYKEYEKSVNLASSLSDRIYLEHSIDEFLEYRGQLDNDILPMLDRIVKLFESLKKDFSDFQSYIRPKKRNTIGKIFDPEYLNNLEKLLDDKDNFYKRVELNNAAYKFRKYFGKGFDDEFIQMEPEVLEGSIKKTIFESMISNAISSRKELRSFSLAAQKRLLRDFRRLDTTIIENNRRRIIENLLRTNGNRTIFTENVKTSEVSLLKKEMLKKKRIKPLRRILAESRDYITSLMPCFLMSPLSIASYLPGEKFNSYFDIVIFDEASQVMPEDALGAILRGKQIIVVGDDKQMPPTSFFQSDRSDEDGDDEIYNFESILEEFISAGIGEAMLKWHYRSKKEKLIQFSNDKYYSNMLMTFPDPIRKANSNSNDIENLPAISFQQVNGVYDKGNSRTNKVEAQLIVEEIVNHLRALHNTKRYYSLGVIAFNKQQADLIADMFRMYLENNPDLEELYYKIKGENSEELFMKNIENVQGDERDIILISIGYGPDHNGKMSLNFGPLNKNGGERRLNVAITRARYGMKIFCSFDPNSVDHSTSNSTGLKHLIEYLQFAKTGVMNQTNRREHLSIQNFESPFEESVARALEDLGYEVDTQIGSAGYRIDLGIVDQNNPSRYIVGIECDGASYHSSRFARDRDRIRHDVLSKLGWKLYHIWSVDWFNSKEAVLNDIQKFIEDAYNKGGDPSVSSSSIARKIEFSKNTEYSTAPDKANFQVTPPATLLLNEGKADKYQIYKSKRIYTKNQFERDDILEKVISSIIETEGPIHRDVIAIRIKEIFHLPKLTKKVKDRINRFVKQHPQLHSPFSDFIGVRVHKPRVFQNKESSFKKIEEFDPYGIIDLITIILEEQKSLEIDELYRLIVRIHWKKSVSQKNKLYLDKILEYLDKKKIISIQGTRVKSP